MNQTYKIPLLIFLSVAIPLFAIGLFFYLEQLELNVSNAQSTAKSKAHAHVVRLDGILDVYSDIANSVSSKTNLRRLMMKEGGADEIRQILIDLINHTSLIEGIEVSLTSTGNNIRTGRSFASILSEWQIDKKEHQTIGFLTNQSGNVFLKIKESIFRDDVNIGTVTTVINPRQFFYIMNDVAGLGDDGAIYIRFRDKGAPSFKSSDVQTGTPKVIKSLPFNINRNEKYPYFSAESDSYIYITTSPKEQFDVIASVSRRDVVTGPIKLRNQVALVSSIALIAIILMLMRLNRAMAIETSRNRFEIALDAAPNGMVMVNEEGKITMANRPMSEIFGYGSNELIGKSIDMLVPKEYRSKHPHLRSSFLQKSEKRSMGAGQELYGVKKSGELVPVEIGLTPVGSLEGQSIVASVIDISERITKNLELSKTTQRFKTLWESSQDMLASVSPDDASIKDCNDRLCERLGYAKKEVVGQSIFKVYHQDCHDEVRVAFSQFVETGFVRSKSLTLAKKNGDKIPVILNVAAIRDHNGKILFSSSSWTDVSEIHQISENLKKMNAELKKVVEEKEKAEQEAASKAEMLSVVVESMDEGLIYGDAAGNLVLLNAAAKKILGIGMTDSKSDEWSEIYGLFEEDQQTLVSAEDLPLVRTLKGEQVRDRILFCKNPKIHGGCYISVNGNPVFDATGNIVAGVVTFNDVTEKRKYLESLADANAELRRSNRDLDDFAYVASHDLKSPLRGIDNLAKWIAEDNAETLSAESIDDLKTLRARVGRMENLLEGLLKYSRIGRVSQNVNTVNLDDLVTNLSQDLDPPPGFNISFIGEVSKIVAKESPLNTVMRNLIENAIKHRRKDDGRVSLTCREHGDFFRFEVCDDGPGIPEDQQTKIFGLFKTLRRRDEVEASGIGLAIVKKTVEQEGGTISVANNADDNGATFTFTWPKNANPKNANPKNANRLNERKH